MLDQNDIQLLSQMFAQQEQRLEQKLTQQLTQQLTEFKVELKTELKTELKAELKAELIPEIMHNVRVLMESHFDPKFEALSEEVRMIREIMVSPQQMEDAEDRIDVLEGVVRLHSREIEALKMA